jgi:arginine N-succinyltransferase
MSRARMMYVAMNRRRFTPEVFSLLHGVTDDAGVSPFWEAVGRKFFGRDFKDIEMASGGRSRTFIAEVMPAYPIYVPLLPEDAQRVLGEPDRSTLLAYEIHLEEGFETDRYVDIFDAGPVLTAQVDRTASVAGNQTRTVRESANAVDGSAWLVASQQGGEFRCALATLPATPLNVAHRGAQAVPLDAPLDAATRAALNVQDGEAVRCAPLYRPDEDGQDNEDASMGEAQ